MCYLCDTTSNVYISKLFNLTIDSNYTVEEVANYSRYIHGYEAWAKALKDVPRNGDL